MSARPGVLLLDEPAAGLNTAETAAIGGLIRRLADSWGIAMLLVARSQRRRQRHDLADPGRRAASAVRDGRTVRPAEPVAIAPARSGLMLVPEQRAVFTSLTTAGNLRLGRGGVDTAVSIFPELQPLLPRRAGLAVRGEQQILGMARALATRPKILITDELSLGLAPQIVDRLYAALQRAAASGVAP